MAVLDYEGLKVLVSNINSQFGKMDNKIETEVKPSTATKQQYDLSANADMTELFDNIYKRFRMIMLNKALVTITVRTSSGTPISNMPITNLFNEDNTICYTNSNGVATGFSTEGAKTFSITGYADLSNFSQSYTLVKGETYSYTWTLSTRNYLSLDASTSVKFSTNVRSLNVSVTGSGANGSSGELTSTYPSVVVTSGSGGNAGQSIIREGVSFSYNTSYNCSVGSGGGSSSFNGITANGGYSYSSNGSGGASVSGSQRQNVSGMAGTSGSQYRYSGYNTRSLCGGGGGSGGTSGHEAYNAGGNSYGGTGGGPYGGSGGNAEYGGSGANASGYAGGGGGGGAYAEYDYNSERYNSRTGSGGSGGPGNIALCMVLKG